MGRASTITEEVEEFIWGELLKTPRPSVSTIYGNLCKLFESRNDPDSCPSEYAVIRRAGQISKILKDNPPPLVDQLEPWSFGANPYYGISDKMTPTLLTIKSLMKSPLSIGEARWIDALYDFLQPKIEKLYPIFERKPESKESQENLLRQVNYHYLIARQYFRMERIAKSRGKHTADTIGLDALYLVPDELQPVHFALGEMFTFTVKELGEKKKEMEEKLRKLQDEGIRWAQEEGAEVVQRFNSLRKEKNNG